MEIINGIQEKANELIQKGYQTDAGSYIQKGWRIFEKDMRSFIGYTALYLLISAFAAFTWIGAFLVSGPLMAGFFIVARKVDKGESYDFATFFKGFDLFAQLLLLSLISGIFITLGFIALVIPGIYLSVACIFATLFIVFSKLEFWDSMELSRKLITRK